MSGTEKRQRRHLLQIRLTEEELTQICEAADRVGLSPASHARQVLLGAPPARSVRRPPIDRTAVSKLLATLGQTSSDLRNITRSSSAIVTDDAVREKLSDSLWQISEMRDVLMSALGRNP
jgi:hypothetical protein